MNVRYFTYLLFFSLLISGSTGAKNRGKKKIKTDFTLLEAYLQRTLPGIPGAPVKTGLHFIIIWQGHESRAATFSWYDDNGWQDCSVTRVHKIRKQDHNIPAGQEYISEQGSAGGIHKGDTLDIMPVNMGKMPGRDKLPEVDKNVLYYIATGSGWRSFPVSNMARKPDIALP